MQRTAWVKERDEERSIALEWRVSERPVAYPDALATMETRVDAIIQKTEPGLIWLLEHPPLYTGGTSAVDSELKDPKRFPVFQTGRGGRYTYHGPGQKVVYAMIDLRERGRDIRDHVGRLEDWMIAVLADFGIRGERREGRIGIWTMTNTGEKKIGALGVRVRKWVAYHGLSLNVAPDLSHFSGIIPCGLGDYGVTSMKDLGVSASMREVDDAFERQLLRLTR